MNLYLIKILHVHDQFHHALSTFLVLLIKCLASDWYLLGKWFGLLSKHMLLLRKYTTWVKYQEVAKHMKRSTQQIEGTWCIGYSYFRKLFMRGSQCTTEFSIIYESFSIICMSTIHNKFPIPSTANFLLKVRASSNQNSGLFLQVGNLLLRG